MALHISDILSGLGKAIPESQSPSFLNEDVMNSLWDGKSFSLIIAEPTIGKTSFILNLAYHASTTFNRKCALLSNNLSSKKITNRLLSISSGISTQKIQNSWLDDSEVNLLKSKSQFLENTTFSIKDIQNSSMNTIEKEVCVAKKDYDLLLIDSLSSVEDMADCTTPEFFIACDNLREVSHNSQMPIIATVAVLKNVEKKSGFILSVLNSTLVGLYDKIFILNSSNASFPDNVSLTGESLSGKIEVLYFNKATNDTKRFISKFDNLTGQMTTG